MGGNPNRSSRPVKSVPDFCPVSGEFLLKREPWVGTGPRNAFHICNCAAERVARLCHRWFQRACYRQVRGV